MREIKFRAWHPVINQFYYSEEYSNLADFFEQVYRFELDDAEMELSQYTGLKDKNGKEIYEGDIVRWFGHEIRIVEWDDVFAGWMIADKLGSTSLTAGGGENMEVIGNIYENPELLEVSDEA